MYTGLEFIIDFFNVEKTVFAEELGVSKQQLNSWLKGQRPIPKKWLKVLSEKYQLDEEIFTKDLDHESQMDLYRHLLKLQNETEEQIEEKVRVLELVNKRTELHLKNLERLEGMLMQIHQREVERSKNCENVFEKVEKVSKEEEKFIFRTDKFLKLIEENNELKLELLDKFFDALLTGKFNENKLK
jgi:transcriptional regulator with XRE-family HTH domain